MTTSSTSSNITRRSTSRRHSIMEALDTYKNIEEKVIRKTKIKDLLKNPDYNKISKSTCHRQLTHLSKADSEKICDCLNEKNSHMTVEELEIATANREETPGSICVLLYDKLYRKSRKRNKKIKSKSHKKSKRRNKASH
jgi:hypothetical protein